MVTHSFNFELSMQSLVLILNKQVLDSDLDTRDSGEKGNGQKHSCKTKVQNESCLGGMKESLLIAANQYKVFVTDYLNVMQHFHLIKSSFFS